VIAQPGDPDLDFDCDNVTITAVVVADRQVIVGLEGGFGWWRCKDGTIAKFEPGDDNAFVQGGEITMTLEYGTDEWFARYVGVLEEWRDSATPLRIVQAPGRPSAIIEDRERWLPIPRRSRGR
jgi:hypothetical protein